MKVKEETRRLERVFAKRFNDSRVGIIQEKVEKERKEIEKVKRAAEAMRKKEEMATNSS